jgi:hypothetical protein
LIIEQATLPTPSDASREEPVLLQIGEGLIERLWATLGVTVDELPDGQQHVTVGEPAR